MRFRLSVTRAVLGAAALLAIGTIGPARDSRADDRDGFELGVYGGLPTMYGKIDTQEGKSTQPIGAEGYNNPSWSWSAMARARLQSGAFSLQGSGEYMDISNEREPGYVRVGPPDGGATVRANVEPKAQVWFADLTAGYRLLDAQKVKLKPTAELYAGARYIWFHPDVSVQLSGLSGSLSPDASWFDPIVGARFGLELSPTVDMLVEGDVGGFGVNKSSDFAWMQMTSLSWEFVDHAKLNLAYKFQQFRRDENNANFREQFRGPYAGLSVVF